MLSAEVVTDLGGALAAAREWDELAVAAGRPFSAPAWMLAWWRHLAPAQAALRLVLVRDGGSLAGVVPCHVASTAARVPVLRLLCAGFTTRMEPLARPGREAEVARAAAAVLAGRPDAPGALALEGLPGGSPWAALLAAAWPGRGGAWRHRDFAMGAPMAEPGTGGYDAWLARRSKGFRKETRRVARRIADEGGVIRLAAPEELDRAVGALLRLYRARWNPRGGSERTSEAVERMVLEAGWALAPQGRFEIWLLEGGGRPVGAELFVRAGAESAAWGGGFVPEWARLGPSIMLMLAAVEHGAGNGVHRFDLGEGAQPYKLKFADRDAGAEWETLYPRGRHYPLARGRAIPRHARWWMRERARRLPPGIQRRLKRATLRAR